jgi:hypothetical protein
MDGVEDRLIISNWRADRGMSRRNAGRSWQRLLRAAIGFAAALCWLFLGRVCAGNEIFPLAHNEPVTVRVVDGKDGKPVALAHLTLVGGYVERDLELRQWTQEALTDAVGALRLRDGLRNLPLIRVEVLKAHGCAAEGFEETFSMDLVRRDGISGPNRCGTVAVESVPGVLIIFVKGKKAGAKGQGDPAQNQNIEQSIGEKAKKPSDPEPEKADLAIPHLSEAQAQELVLAIIRVLDQN